MKALGLVIVAWGIATSTACATPYDADGTWNMFLRWQSLDCGILAPSQQQVVVATDETGAYTVTSPAGEVVESGVTVNVDGAALHAVIAGDGGVAELDVTAAGSGLIGHGTLTLTAPHACQVGFFVGGTLEAPP